MPSYLIKQENTPCREAAYIEDGTYNLYQRLETDIVVEKGAVTMTGDIIDALNTLSVSGQEKAKVDNAITFIRNVRDRIITNATDIEQNIHDILKAIDSLLYVTSIDISEIRLKMDELLMIWETKWSLY
jgi:transcription termination factor NusB